MGRKLCVRCNAWGKESSDGTRSTWRSSMSEALFRPTTCRGKDCDDDRVDCRSLQQEINRQERSATTLGRLWELQV